jgi:hypothetical protein
MMLISMSTPSVLVPGAARSEAASSVPAVRLRLGKNHQRGCDVAVNVFPEKTISAPEAALVS